MNNERTRNVIKIAALFVIIFVFAITLLASCSGHSSKPLTNKQTRYINDSASSDTPVETLKTLTAEISAVEQQNQKLIEQNKALTEQDKKTLAQFKNDVMADVQKQMNELKNANQASIEEAKKSLDKPSNNKSTNRNNGAIDNETIAQNDNLTWVSDLQSTSTDPNTNSVSNSNNRLLPLNTEEQKPKISFDNNRNINKPLNSVPHYTIPVNATL